MNLSRVLNPPKSVSIEHRLKSWNIEYNFKRNQPYLSRGLNLSRRSNSLNSASGVKAFEIRHLWQMFSFLKKFSILYFVLLGNQFYCNPPIKLCLNIYLIRILEQRLKRSWVFATISTFLIPIYLQTYGVNLWYFKLDSLI